MLLFLFLLVPSISCFNFTEDYSILKRTEKCEESCWFPHPEISPETISSWPSNCSSVCALLTFSSNSNGIPFETLKTSFKKMEQFNGVLRVENTTFNNLSFFGPKWIVFKTNELSFLTLSIMNNRKLSNVDILFKMIYTKERLVQIINNPKLDKDNRWIEECQKCDWSISIHDTDFENLSFLLNLENLVGDGGRLVISNNPDLKRLGWDSLKKVLRLPSGAYSATFQNNHPDFCLSMEEATALTSRNMNFTAFEAKYCNITTRKDGKKTCVFTGMSNLDNGCVHIMGKLVIDSGDEEYTQKLENVTDIYGPLVIQNTTLSDLSFLGNLKHVAVLNDSSPAIWLKDNLNLSNVWMHNLRYPYSPGPNRFIMENLSPDLFTWPTDCHNYQSAIYARVLYNGKNCTINTQLGEVALDQDNGEVLEKCWIMVFLVFLCYFT